MIFTIGHSTLDAELFVAHLVAHGVTAVADVRSAPFSRFNPQFNRDSISVRLRRQRIAYVFMGGELGARSNDPRCYENGKVQYDRLARTQAFRAGVDRLHDGERRETIALMCAEQDPLQCHRAILVAAELRARGVDIAHILVSGHIETHEDAMMRLLKEEGLDCPDLFRSQRERIEEARRRRGDEIAYVSPATAREGA